MNATAEARGAQGSNISCLKREDCSQLFFVYAGGMGGFEAMSPVEFLRKSGLSNRNIAFIRDPQTLYFTKGVSEEIPDLDAVLDWHHAHIAANPHVDEIYCMGNSFGGWAALFFGYMLGVKKVFALAPAGPWGRKLLVDLMAEGNGVTEYEIYYSRREPSDERFAKVLEHLPGVRLLHREAHGHLMLRGLMNSGELHKILPPFRAAGSA